MTAAVCGSRNGRNDFWAPVGRRKSNRNVQRRCTTGATRISGTVPSHTDRPSRAARMGSGARTEETRQIHGLKHRQVGFDHRVAGARWAMVPRHTVRGRGQIRRGCRRNHRDGSIPPREAVRRRGRFRSAYLALQPPGARVRSFRRLAARCFCGRGRAVSRLTDLARYADTPLSLYRGDCDRRRRTVFDC
jgi:hypothetical protein